jgi:hypothetical protein
LKGGLVVRLAAGHAEDRDEESHRHQRRPHPFRLCHRDDSADDRVVHFHNFVFLLLICFSVPANDQFADLFLATVGCLVRGDSYPQQPSDFSAGFATTDADRNFCRQWSLQKQNVFPSRSAWRPEALSTVIPQMGSMVTDFDSFIVVSLSWLLSLHFEFLGHVALGSSTELAPQGMDCG